MTKAEKLFDDIFILFVFGWFAGLSAGIVAMTCFWPDISFNCGRIIFAAVTTQSIVSAFLVSRALKRIVT